MEGFDSALERAHALLEAGADVLFVEAPAILAQMKTLGATFAGKVPLLANMVEGGRTPVSSSAELAAIGFKLVIFPGAMARVVSYAAIEYLNVLKADGATQRMAARMHNFDQLNKILGIDSVLAEGARYGAKESKSPQRA